MPEAPEIWNQVPNSATGPVSDLTMFLLFLAHTCILLPDRWCAHCVYVHTPRYSSFYFDGVWMTSAVSSQAGGWSYRNPKETQKSISSVRSKVNLAEAYRYTWHFSEWFVGYCLRDAKNQWNIREPSFRMKKKWEFKVITHFWICFPYQGNAALKLIMQQFATLKGTNCTIHCSLKLTNNCPTSGSWC